MPKIAKKKKTVVCQTREEAMDYVRHNAYGVETLEERWRADKEVMMLAVQLNGTNLEFASEQLQADRELVYAAVKQNYRSLTYAARELRDDFEMRKFAYSLGSVFIVDPVAWRVFERDDARMMRETVRTRKVKNSLGQTVEEVVFIEEGEPDFDPVKTLRHPVYNKYKDFYLGTISTRDMMLLEKELIASTIRTKEAAMDFLSTSDGARAFAHLDVKLRADRDIALQAVVMRGENLRYCDDKFKADREIVEAAIEQDPYALVFAADEFRNSFEFRERVYKKVGFFVANETLRKRIRKIERERATGPIRRPSKQFKTRAEYEKNMVEEALKLIAYERKRDLEALVDAGELDEVGEVEALAFESLSIGEMIEIETQLVNPSLRRKQTKKMNAKRPGRKKVDQGVKRADTGVEIANVENDEDVVDEVDSADDVEQQEDDSEHVDDGDDIR